MNHLRRWLFPLAAVLCLGGFVVVWLQPGHSHAAEVPPAPPAAPLTLLWSRPITGFRGAALSPQGELIAVAGGAKGAVSLWHWRTQPDHPLWVHSATEASNVAVSALGSFVLAWSAMDPAQPDFTILRGEDGATLSHRMLDGAIWDAQLSADGCYAGAVTGGKYLHLYTLSDQPLRTRFGPRQAHSILPGLSVASAIHWPSPRPLPGPAPIW